ncbi:MAG: hypothetical protein ACLTLY_03950 [Agathobacter rectalis]
MKLRNRIRIFAVIFILALGMEYLPMAVYAAGGDSGRKRYGK